jgi:hypothetical protein
MNDEYRETSNVKGPPHQTRSTNTLIIEKHSLGGVLLRFQSNKKNIESISKQEH